MAESGIDLDFDFRLSADDLDYDELCTDGSLELFGQLSSQDSDRNYYELKSKTVPERLVEFNFSSYVCIKC